MTIQEAAAYIGRERPACIYLTGKTCTGKTTLSAKLQQNGYQTVMLDQVVHDAVITPFELTGRDGDVFVSVYKTADQPAWVTAFVQETRKRIARLVGRGKPVIIEGAVANPAIIQQILHNLDADFLYLHPSVASSNYVHNITQRFIGTNLQNHNGLPNAFWSFIDTDAFEKFCNNKVLTPMLQNAISRYAQQSHLASVTRLAAMRKYFPAIITVEI